MIGQKRTGWRTPIVFPLIGGGCLGFVVLVTTRYQWWMALGVLVVGALVLLWLYRRKA